MGVNELIADAEFGIKCIRTDTSHFNFYFRGTLASLKGILDQIIEEYNTKYKLGISLSENLYPEKFKKVARTQKNLQALKFIQYYNSEKCNLLKDTKIKFLLDSHGMRDIEIHRKTLPRNVKMEIEESLTSSIHIEARDEGGTVVSTADSKQIKPDEIPPVIVYFLKDWEKDDIPTLCEHSLLNLKNFISDIRTNFP